MKMSANGLDMLQDLEGVRYVAYLDTGGVWTIGVGHTGPEVVKGLRADHTQVMKWLEEDVVEAEDCVNSVVKVPLTQNQFDSLVSFVFNVGVNAFRSSTMLKRLNAGDYEGAANQFSRWVYDNGKRINGLVLRRKLEAENFVKP